MAKVQIYGRVSVLRCFLWVPVFQRFGHLLKREGEIGQVKYPLHTKISLLGGQIGEFEFQRELGVCAQDTGRGSLDNLDARLCPGCDPVRCGAACGDL